MLSQGRSTFLPDLVISAMELRHNRFNRSKGEGEKTSQRLTQHSGRTSWRRAGGDTVRVRAKECFVFLQELLIKDFSPGWALKHHHNPNDFYQYPCPCHHQICWKTCFFTNVFPQTFRKCFHLFTGREGFFFFTSLFAVLQTQCQNTMMRDSYEPWWLTIFLCG